MHPFQFMTDDQLIAGLNDFAERAEAGEVDDTEIESIITFVDNKAQNMQRLIQTGADIRERGVCQADLARLEEISPGVTAGLNSGDYTFLASQHGLEPALNAIDWKAVGKWGIIGAIIAAIIALIAKIMGRSKGSKSPRDAINQNYERTRTKHDEKMKKQREEWRKEDEEFKERERIREEKRASMTEEEFRKRREENEKKGYYEIDETLGDRDKTKKQQLKKAIEESKYGDLIKSNLDRLNGLCNSKLTAAEYLKLPLSDLISKDKDITDEALASVYSFCFEHVLNETQRQSFHDFTLRFSSGGTYNTIRNALELDEKSLELLMPLSTEASMVFEDILKIGMSIKARTNMDKEKEKVDLVIRKLKAILTAGTDSSKSFGTGGSGSDDQVQPRSVLYRILKDGYGHDELKGSGVNYAEMHGYFKNTISGKNVTDAMNILPSVTVLSERVGKFAKEMEAESKHLEKESNKLSEYLTEVTRLKDENKAKKDKLIREGGDPVEINRLADQEETAGDGTSIASVYFSVTSAYIQTQKISDVIISISRFTMSIATGTSFYVAQGQAGIVAHDVLTSKVNEFLKILVSIR